jgi:RNA polymerase sigma factor (sigma-70 family)
MPVLAMSAESATHTANEPPAISGTGAGFEDFYRAEQPGLFGALYLITGNRQEAEEVMQEAFLRIWERWDRIEGMENPAGYLYRTAMNAFRMRRRRLAVAARRALRLIPPSDAFDAVDDRDAVDRALANLSPRQRAAVILTDLLGFTSVEAGSMLGIRSATVRVMASKARAAMRTSLGASDE